MAILIRSGFWKKKPKRREMDFWEKIWKQFYMGN